VIAAIRRAWKRRVGNQRGAVMVVVALSLVAIMGFAALVVDLGMLFTARSQAQGAADAAALAGASAFVDPVLPPTAFADEARQRAQNWNTDHGNRILGHLIEVDEVTVVRVELQPKYEVKVQVERAVPTYFARVLGIDVMTARARSTAAAVAGTSANCVKPFAIPDLWHETNTTAQDRNGNRIWDYDETWLFQPDQGDRYERLGDGANATGYGSTFRDQAADFGRLIKLKLNDPAQTNYPSVFQSWQTPGPNGESVPGYNHFRDSIADCNPNPVLLEKDYGIQTGGGTGPTIQGVADLICQDPDARWNGSEITGSRFANPEESPRMITLALYDPHFLTSPGHQKIRFNNFARFFLETPQEWEVAQHPSDKLLQCNNDGTARNPLPSAEVVQGRFLFYVAGGTAGQDPGTLVKAIRLIN
jgi:Flp pilus assembly protein TadG